MEPLLTSKEAAAYLAVCKETIERLARQGRIPAVKVGKVWRFVPHQLQEWVNRSADKRA